MSTIAITGVAGFIGSNLADRLLSMGHTVIGVDNLAYGVRSQIPEGVEFREMDIRSCDLKGAFQGANAVFHLAAKNCIADCQNDPVETADINVTGTVNVFEASRQAGIKRIIYAESSAMYEGSETLPSVESDVAPQSFYAVSKAGGAGFADAYARFHQMEMTALRYFGVYGPRQDYRRTIPPVMSAFIIKLLRGEQPTIYGNGKKGRDFIYVDDINDFHVLCLHDRRTVGGVFNLGYGRPYSINEIYEKIATLLGSSLRPIYQADLEAEAQVTHADISKAKELGWSPQVSLDEGLQRSIDFIKAHVEITA